MTPRIAPTPNDNIEASFAPAQGMLSELNDQGRFTSLYSFFHSVLCTLYGGILNIDWIAIKDMDLFDSCFESTEFSTMPSSSLSSSVTNDIRLQANPIIQQNLDDSDAEKQQK